jgi:hypothetical protein
VFTHPAVAGRGSPSAPGTVTPAPAAARRRSHQACWRVTVDPAAANARAIRAWGKAGFVYERDRPDHPAGPAVLMTIAADPEVAGCS